MISAVTRSAADYSVPAGLMSLKLPATSANLGPGFDTLALALALFLEIDAEVADTFQIRATGRDVEVCSRLHGNLLLEVYCDTVQAWTGHEAPPLRLTMRNEIPLGMGCGSSAASRLAALVLASHFGGLRWSREQILAQAARLEGHPDNVAACWMGGFVAAGWDAPALAGAAGVDPAPLLKGGAGAAMLVAAISIAPPAEWHALLVLPAVPLATTASRGVLPDHYSRPDAVLNLQRVAVLTAAFASGRGDLLRAATHDSLHQPYRAPVCPLLPLLLPLAGHAGILSVTLSGAGPAVLLLLADAQAEAQASLLVWQQVSGHHDASVAEIVACTLCQEASAAAVLPSNKHGKFS